MTAETGFRAVAIGSVSLWLFAGYLAVAATLHG